METPRKHTATKKTVDGHHSAKRKSELTPIRASPKSVLRSAGGNAKRTAIRPDELSSLSSECLNYRRKVTDIIDTHGRLESGSGSGEQDGGQHDDGMDNGAKKRRTRRGKPKHRKMKPYSKLKSLEERLTANRQPPAPYNTTQFLMADHSDLPDLEQKLSKATSLDIPASLFQKPPPATRTRDSSFSIDSNDDEYFYSSPEDEEEFLTKEFSSAYEALREERLNSLTKSELLQEYRLLEAKLDTLTKRLRNKGIPQVDGNDAESKNVSVADAEVARKGPESKNSSNTDLEVMKKLKLCQQRVDDLIQQIKQLSQENEQLRKYAEKARRLRKSSSESTIDTECDSDSNSSNSSSSDNSRKSCSECSVVSSTQTSPNNISYKSRLDNKKKTGDRIDSCETSQSESPRTTPTNFSNGLTITNETGGLPT